MPLHPYDASRDSILTYDIIDWNGFVIHLVNAPGQPTPGIGPQAGARLAASKHSWLKFLTKRFSANRQARVGS